MRRLHRAMTIGAAASLVMAALVGTAGAAPPFEDPPATEAQARKVPSETTGRAASLNAMRSGRLSCGEAITRSTTLTADVGPCPGDGIIIGADNIMLNVNGHTISGIPGPGSGNDGGIRLPNRTGVRITGLPGSSGKKGTVTGFDAGVVVNGGSGNTIENLNVRDNVGTRVPVWGDWEDPAWWETPAAWLGDGIVVFKSSRNRIVNNVVTNNGVYDGIGVFGIGADANTVERNTVKDTVGILGNRSASGTGIVINHFLDQRPGGLEIIESNSATGNTVRRNAGSGISSVGNFNGQIVGNVAEDNGLAYAEYAEYFYGEAAANGIGVQPGGGRDFQQLANTNMLVKNNIVNHNGLNGIFLRGTGNRVETNQVFANGWFGIYAGAMHTQLTPANSITFNSTGNNVFLDLFDESGPSYVPDPSYYCADNVWFGNTWGDVSPLALQYGYDTAYAPDCTATGGSGPNPPSSG